MENRLYILPPPQADRRDFFLHLASWFEGEVEVAMEPHSSLWSKLLTESELLLDCLGHASQRRPRIASVRNLTCYSHAIKNKVLNIK